MSLFKDVFISYGRKESLSFAGRLHQQLKLQGYDCWFDKVNIPDGDDYALRIKHGIESAHNFVYIMAPRSLTSPYCLLELEYARLLGKRVIPMNQMVGFDIDIRELTQEEISTLNRFYQEFQLPNPKLENTQDVRDRSISLIGKTDWLDAKEELEEADCQALSEWAMQYENHWHKHKDVAFLSPLKLPAFGKGIDAFESILERLIEVLEREKSYVAQHTEILQNALDWIENQKQTNFLAVGEERKQALQWLLQPFTGGRQIPATPSAWHCEFIMESRKNAENLMTDVFICCSSKDKSIKDNIVSTLSRYGITTWNYERDIRKGEDYQQAILRGIEEADNFMLFISPEATSSQYCYKEYEYALQHQKRIIPLLIKPTDAELQGLDNFPQLTNIQYVDFTDNVIEEDYHRDIDEVLNFLKQEEKYFEEHKQLLTKALKWEKNQQKPVFLLRGFNLDNAQTWLRINEKREQNAPTALHKSFIKASAAAKGNLATEVFISYSRKDSDFARQLNNALQEAGTTTWFDQESIATGADFQAEIYKGISSSDNFLFIISPDAVDSLYCADEVAYASEHNKRFISILHKETDTNKLPASLAKVQWLDFEQRDFSESFIELIQAIELDQDHAHQHTVLQQRATEWEENERSSDFLLNISAFTNANTWLENGTGKIPPPTILQKEYILKSKEAIKAAEAKERAIENRLNKRLRIAGAALGIAVLFILVAVYFGWQSYKNEQIANNKTKETALALNAAKDEKERAENALANLAKNQKELELEKEKALASRNTAEIRRIESEEARLIAQLNEKRAVALRLTGSAKDYLREGKNSEAMQVLKTAFASTELKPTLIQQSIVQANTNIKNFQIAYFKHPSWVETLAFSPDGKHFLTAGYDSIAILWDLKGNQIQVFKGHNYCISSVAFSPDGKQVLTGSGDNIAILWDLKGNQIQAFKGHTKWVASVVFSPDGKHVLTGSSDQTAILWDLEGNQIQTFKGHTDNVSSVAFSPDGSKILTSSKDNTAILWSKTGAKIQVYKGFNGYNQSISSIAFSPDGQRILAGCEGKTAILWDLKGNEIQVFKGHNKEVSSVAFSPSGYRILTGSHDNTAILWDLEGNQIETFKGHSNKITSVAFSPDGWSILTGGQDYTAILWDLKRIQNKVFLRHKKWVSSVAFSPNGKQFLTSGGDTAAILWDLGGNQVQVFKGHTDNITAVAFSPDGKKILTGSRDKTAILWDLRGNQIKVFEGHYIGITSVAFSPNGRQVFTGSKDETAILWDLRGNKVQVFNGHTNYVNSVAFSPDGRRVLTGSADKTAILWDLKGNQIQTFNGHNKYVSSVALSSDGRHVLTGSGDNTAILWDLKGNQVQVFKGHYLEVYAVAFSPDGRQVLTGGRDRKTILWDLKGSQVQTFESHYDDVLSVAISQDGQHVLTGSSGETAILWKTPKGIIEHWSQLSVAPLQPEDLVSLELMPALSEITQKTPLEQYWFAEYFYKEEQIAMAKQIYDHLYQQDYHFTGHVLTNYLDVYHQLDKPFPHDLNEIIAPIKSSSKLWILGEYFKEKEEYKKAKLCLQKALEINERKGIRNDLAKVELAIGG